MLCWLVLLALLAPDARQLTDATVVEGDVPADLVGRWLVVEQNRLPTGVVQPFARLWEIRRGPGHLALAVRRVRLPDALGTKLAAAGSANRPWAPDDGDLRELAGRWNELPPSASGALRIDSRLVGPDVPPSDPEHEAVTGGSSLVIVIEERFPAASPVRTRHSVYTVRERAPARLVGSFVSDSTVETPAPVSIALKGDFRAYRVLAVPQRSRLQRLLDAFLGRHEPS